jgi:hypothetical protein
VRSGGAVQCSAVQCSPAENGNKASPSDPTTFNSLQQSQLLLLLFPTRFLTLVPSRDFLFSTLLLPPCGVLQFRLCELFSSLLRAHRVSPPSLPKAAAFSLAIREPLHLLHLVQLLSARPLHINQVSLPPPLRKRASFLGFGFHCYYSSQSRQV